MNGFKIQELRAAVLIDLREFVPKNYYRFVRTDEDIAYRDITLAERLHLEQHYTPQFSPRQLTAVWLLKRIGLYCHKYESVDPEADAAEGITPEIIKEMSLEHLHDALTQYTKYLPEHEAKALAGMPELEKAANDGTAGEVIGKVEQTAESLPSVCSDFLLMSNLTAREVSIEFAAGDLGSVILNVSARGVTRRLALVELDLFDRRNSTMNKQGLLLLGMAEGRRVRPDDNGTRARQIVRLRDALKKRLGVTDNPITHCVGEGYLPVFKISDSRSAADIRAKREAERRTVSLNKLEESGMQVSGGIEQADYSFEPEGDATDEWLERNVS